MAKSSQAKPTRKEAKIGRPSAKVTKHKLVKELAHGLQPNP